MAAMIAGIIFLGVYPQPILDALNPRRENVTRHRYRTSALIREESEPRMTRITHSRIGIVCLPIRAIRVIRGSIRSIAQLDVPVGQIDKVPPALVVL